MAESPNSLIADRYSIELSRPMPEVGSGLPAFAAVDRRGGDAKLVALAASRFASPRQRCLEVLDRPIDNLMMPIAHGVGPQPGGGQGYYVICTAPFGQPAALALTPWPEAALLEHVLRPIAQVLIALQELRITHRAIRPDNVFVTSYTQPVTLGAAWAAPPALLQPAVFEPPFSALCLPAGRGEGTIADDIYALGVLLITLATGRVPMAGLDDDSIIRRKLDLGSYAALTAGAAVPPYLSDLLRGMLADDPDHRSPARLLMDPTTARARRVAARPPRRSQRPLILNDIAVFDARMLAYALARDERKSILALRAGVVSQWLRRGLGDGTLAAAIEELVRVRLAEAPVVADADTRLLMNTIATVEPRMPLCWRETAFWPDALGALLAEGFHGQSKLVLLAEEVLRGDAIMLWENSDSDSARDDGFLRSFEGRQLRAYLQRNGVGAMHRLLYGMNPLLPCDAPGTTGTWMMTMPDLLEWLERLAAGDRDAELFNSHVLAFIAARADRQITSAVNVLLGLTDAGAYLLRLMGLLCDLQVRYVKAPLPGLSAWAAAHLRHRLETYRNRQRREALIAQLDALAADGFIEPLLALIEDERQRSNDVAGAEQAIARVAAIDRELAVLEHSDAARRAMTAGMAREMAAAVGMTTLILMFILAAIE
ncbi:MAG: hypothetical protein U1E70_24020 [Acetobacteraceae bacterium]